MVINRRKKEKSYISVKIDRELHEEYVTLNFRDGELYNLHVYFYDSFSTIVREFRTIKCCEFFPTADIILKP